ncbi:NAD(P)-dependent oxidoreductase [Paraburkholderia sp. BL21I4N1]|uniref:NAD(P)-dependent oxidoreductase n=1 Tax=Paraburkholderia sp. BL21I4N1 TaxID=1938801 RepID=UPI000CFCAA06|nr:NAD(P)-dependent oxidoreductase [Paraburkholderia sp. BL21I4N1]PQV45604.1 3-hydroxyisobutyrate dehydrogenase-like beta-hydroxyacid dehydrogenase [Paraburkholderia sp. BL21I4N1]
MSHDGLPEAPRVGFCGIGKMGEPMAWRLLAAGHALRVWNRSAAKLAHLEAHGAVVDDSPMLLAARSDVVMLCLGDARAVEEVVFGAEGLARAARAPRFLIDHSTIAPKQSRQFAQRWHELTGGAWIDAPVSGGTAGAAAGTLAILCGGDAMEIAAVEPLLRAYASRVTRMGASGAGQATKLANQAIVATTIAGIAEACVLAQRTGIDAASMAAALQGGWADSVPLQTLLPRMLTPPSNPSGTIRTMLKDLDAVAELARESHAPLRAVGEVRKLLQEAVEQGLGDEDISQIVRVLLKQPMSEA